MAGQPSTHFYHNKQAKREAAPAFRHGGSDTLPLLSLRTKCLVAAKPYVGMVCKSERRRGPESCNKDV